MKFLGDNWKKNYILSKDSKLIDWQHYSSKKKRYNFVIATSDSKIIGCLGFINHSNFSNKLSSDDTLWLVNWLIIKKAPISGLQLISFLIKKLNYNRIGTIGGINSKTHTILKALGFKVGELNHYYIVNPTINKFKLINIPTSLIISSKSTFNIEKNKLELLNAELQLNIFGNHTDKLVKKFGKDQSYFIKRYTLHPYYKYKIYLIYSLNRVLGFFVTRICEFRKKKALRIVDFFGHDEALIGINDPLQKLIININAEYADFYEYAIDSSIMLQTGLLKNNFDNKIIIPNHFEPFLKKNICLKWSVKSNNSSMTPILKEIVIKTDQVCYKKIILNFYIV